MGIERMSNCHGGDFGIVNTLQFSFDRNYKNV